MLKKSFIAIVIMTMPVVLMAQTPLGQMGKLKAIVNEFKNLKEYGYSYVMNVSYPDKTSEKINGRIYISASRHLMYNSNASATMYYSDKWLYRADHDNKSITILNLERPAYDSLRKIREAELFANQLSNEYIDSFIVKYGRIQNYNEKNGTINISLLYDQDAGPLRKIELVYKMTRKIPLKFVMYLFYPIEENTGKTAAGINYTITCSDYTRATAIDKISDFFVVKNNKVILKKFKNYKSYTLL